MISSSLATLGNIIEMCKINTPTESLYNISKINKCFQKYFRKLKF